MTKTSARELKTLLVFDLGSDLLGSICQTLALTGRRLLLVGRDDADLEVLDASLAQNELHRFTSLATLGITELTSWNWGERVYCWVQAQELEPEQALLLFPTGGAPEPEIVDRLLRSLWPDRAHPDQEDGVPPTSRAALVLLAGAPHAPVPIQPEAVRAWLEKLAASLTEARVRLNLLLAEQVISPGALERAQELAKKRESSCQTQLAEWASAVPLGELVPAAAVAEVVGTMLGSFSSHLSGCVINLDGGTWAARQK